MEDDIRGYRGTVPPVRALVDGLKALPPATTIQLLRADRIVGRDHLVAAIHQADRAFATGCAVASAWPLEVLRYAAGERQLAKALAFLGLAEGDATIAAVVRGDAAPFDRFARDLLWTRDDAVLDASPAKLAAWDAATRTLPPERRADAVLERVALADIAR